MRVGPLLGFILVLAGCAQHEPVAEPDAAQQALIEQDEQQLRAALAKVRSAAAGSQTVTLFRVAQPLDANYAELEKTATRKVAGYPVLHEIPLTKEQAATLLEMLTNRGTYMAAGIVWSCLFEPHHVLQAGGTDIVICVECGEVELGTYRKSVHPEANARLKALLNALPTA